MHHYVLKGTLKETNRTQLQIVQDKRDKSRCLWKAEVGRTEWWPGGMDQFSSSGYNVCKDCKIGESLFRLRDGKAGAPEKGGVR